MAQLPNPDDYFGSLGAPRLGLSSRDPAMRDVAPPAEPEVEQQAQSAPEMAINSKGHASVPASTQTARDAERVRILNDELASAQQRAAAGDQRAQGDIESLQREIARAGGKAAPAGASPGKSPESKSGSMPNPDDFFGAIPAPQPPKPEKPGLLARAGKWLKEAGGPVQPLPGTGTADALNPGAIIDEPPPLKPGQRPLPDGVEPSTGRRMGAKAGEAAAYERGQQPYRSRQEAIDDAVDRLESGADPKQVYDAFFKSPMVITSTEIDARGLELGGPHFSTGRTGTVRPGAMDGQVRRIDRGAMPGDQRLLEPMLDMATRAKEQVGLSTDVMMSEAGVLSKEGLAGRIVERTRRTDAAAPTLENIEGQQAIQKAGKQGILDAMAAMRDNPLSTLTMLADSVLQSLPVSAGAGVLGLAAGGAIGAGAGAFAGSAAQEYAAAILEAVREHSGNPNNPADVLAALQNPEVMAAARKKGAIRGLTIGAFDAVSAGLAGRFVGPVIKAIEGGALTGRAAKKAAAVATGKEVGMQAGLGAGGEIAGTVAAGDQINWADALMEAMAEIPGGIPEAAGNIMHKRGKEAKAADAEAAPMRPTEQKADILNRLDDFAVQTGMPERIVAGIKKAADGVPLGELAGRIKSAISSLAQRGIFKGPVDEQTLSVLDEPTKPAEQDAQPAATPAPGVALQDEDYTGLSDPTPRITTPVDEAAHQAAASPTNDRPEPTDGQKQAGNYQKGHLRIAGLDLAIENPQGSKRRGVAPDGTPWESTLTAHYGYVKGTKASDGDHSDVFIKPGTQNDHAGPVYVIDQIDPATGKFDEHKTVIGASSEAEARALYLSNYDQGWKGLGAITQLPVDAYRSWVKDGIKRKPLGAIDERVGDVADPAGQLAGSGASGRPEPGRSVGAVGSDADAPRPVGDAAPAPAGSGQPPVAVATGSGADAALTGTPTKAPTTPTEVTPTRRVIGKYGRTPNAATEVELRPNADGTLTPFDGKHAMVDFESGNPIVMPADVTDAQAADAIRKAGAITPKDKFFGVKPDAKPAQQDRPASGPVQPAADSQARADLDAALGDLGSVLGASKAETSPPAEGAGASNEGQGQEGRRRETRLLNQPGGAVMPAGLRVTFGGKTYPVESVEDAQRKWIKFQESADGGAAAGVSQVGNGIPITDGAGRLVARVAFNGRAFDAADNLLAEAPDTAAPTATVSDAPKPAPRTEARANGKHPATVMGSRLLALVSSRLGGLDPAWLPDFSHRQETKRIGKNGKPIVSWRNPMVTGIGTLFRRGGTQDLQLLAEMLEEAGYLPPGSVEADAKEAGEQAKRMVTDALNRVATKTQDQIQAEAEADIDAERNAYYAELDAESAREAEAERQAIIEANSLQSIDRLDDDDIPWDAPIESSPKADADFLGITVEELERERLQDQVQGDAQEQAGDGQGPDANGPEGAQAAAGARGPAPGRGPEDGQEEGVSARRAEHRREMERELELQAQTEAELRAKAEREAAAAAADAKEQKRLADKAIADAGLGEFTLTGSDRPADVAAAAGQGGLFDDPEPAPAPQRIAHDPNGPDTLQNRSAFLETLSDDELRRLVKKLGQPTYGKNVPAATARHLHLGFAGSFSIDEIRRALGNDAPASAPATKPAPIQLTDAEVFADDFARLEGKPLAQTITVADTGQTATLKMDAAKAMRAQQARLDALKALRTCLGA